MGSIVSEDLKIPEGFKLGICSVTDKAEVCRIYLEAMANDQLWTSIVRNVADSKEIFPWVCANFASRWYLPDVILFKITENSSKKIAGWGALQVPWKFKQDDMTEKLKREASLSEISVVDGMDKVALAEYFKVVKASALHGYDPEEDYHRLGTMILPEYQKRGLGSFLTRHCTQISDLAAARQWVPARPSSVEMFKKNGFLEAGTVDSHLEQFGGTRESSKSYVLLRSPS